MGFDWWSGVKRVRRWDFTTGRRRAEVLTENFDAAMQAMREDRRWWPDTRSSSAWLLLRVRELGPTSATEDPRVRRWLVSALHEWGAHRGGTISSRRLASVLSDHRFRGLLEQASQTELARLDDAAMQLICGLFRGLEGIKSSNAQVVVVSKALYHLLPELVVPLDNEVTCGFFGWRSLPNRVDDEWLADIYGVLSQIARGVGPRALARHGQPDWPRDQAVALAIRLGQGRVVDFGMKGYRRSTAKQWYVA